MSELCVVIRSVGERTEVACMDSVLANNVNPDLICVVRERPFEAALFKSLELGLSSGARWVLCLDADVVLRSDSIAKMLSEAERLSTSSFEIQFLVLDKFFGGPRAAGNHLYRSRYIHKALHYRRDVRGEIRPETAMLERMKNQGFPWHQSSSLVGIHDFQQWSKDVFRKFFIHAYKHPELVDRYTSTWLRLGMKDPDFRVGLAAVEASKSYVGHFAVDTDLPEMAKRFTELNLAEKAPVLSKDINVDEIIERWSDWFVYRSLYPDRFGIGYGISGTPFRIARKVRKIWQDLRNR